MNLVIFFLSYISSGQKNVRCPNLVQPKTTLSNKRTRQQRIPVSLVPARFFRRCKDSGFGRFNCSGSYLLKLVGHRGETGVKTPWANSDKRHTKTPLESYMNHIILYIGPYIFGHFFQSFFFSGGKVVVFSYAFFFFGRHLIFEKVPKETCPVVAWVFFPMKSHQLRRRVLTLASLMQLITPFTLGSCYIRQRCGTAEKWL